MITHSIMDQDFVQVIGEGDSLPKSTLDAVKLSDHQKMDLLLFMSSMTLHNGLEIERSLNAFLTKLFRVELTFIIHKNPSNGKFFVRAIGDAVVLKKRDFFSPSLQKLIQSGESLCPEDFNQEDLNYVQELIKNLSGIPIMSLVSVYCKQTPLFIVLMNNSVGLKQGPIVQAVTKKFYSGFSDVTRSMLTKLMLLCYPIVMVALKNKTISRNVELFSKMADIIFLSMLHKNHWRLSPIIRLSKFYFTVDSFAIYLFQEDKEHLIGTIGLHDGVDYYEEPAIYAACSSLGVIGRVIKGEEISFKSPTIKTRFYNHYTKETIPYKDIFGVPIKYEDEMKGAIQVTFERGNITDDDIQDMRGIANICGIAHGFKCLQD